MPYRRNDGRVTIVGVNKNQRVLVVDDYPGARYRRMRILLDAGGFDVAEESLGRDALRRVAKERFDVVVIDLHLPDVSGLEVCRALKADAATAAIAILAVSAVSDAAEAQRTAVEAGATAFVADESDADTFLRAVRAAAGSRVAG
jgi:CheY-like chemotaxis protein